MEAETRVTPLLFSIILLALPLTAAAAEPDAAIVEAAMAGDVAAQHRLCVGYRYGELGFDRNETEAFAWCSKGAEAGASSSQTLLAEIYHFGDGVQKDEQKAMHYYRLAAEQGHVHAQFMLARLSFHAIRPRQPEAYCKWMGKSASQGYQKAVEAMQSIEQFLKEAPDSVDASSCESMMSAMFAGQLRPGGEENDPAGYTRPTRCSEGSIYINDSESRDTKAGITDPFLVETGGSFRLEMDRATALDRLDQRAAKIDEDLRAMVEQLRHRIERIPEDEWPIDAVQLGKTLVEEFKQDRDRDKIEQVDILMGLWIYALEAGQVLVTHEESGKRVDQVTMERYAAQDSEAGGRITGVRFMYRLKKVYDYCYITPE